MGVASELADQGFVVVPRLLTAGEVEDWTVRMERLSGIARGDFARRTRWGLKRRGLAGAWTLPDGVSRSRDFWPLAVHDRIVGSVRELLGDGARFLQHTDLHVGFSALGWHRDSVNRTCGEGGDWDESREPYQILRVGVYLQSSGESRFRLGVIPGTHRPPRVPPSRERQRVESAAAWTSPLLRLLGRDPFAATARWLEVGSGDCVLFDPRLLHSGSPIDGPKYSFFLAYGIPGAHFQRHRAYYRHRRKDLGYEDLAPELVERLRAADLLAPETPFPSMVDLTGAFQPPSFETALARGLRFVKHARP